MASEIKDEIAEIAAKLRVEGYPQFRVDAFEERARAGKWAKAWGILHKTICGARRRDGGICLAGWRHNMRCRVHGGGTPTPGPTTQAGRDRIAAAQRARWERWRAERFHSEGSKP